MSKLIKDINHWQNLLPPMCPNADEIAIYEKYTKNLGPVCLLGMTKELQHICEYMVDLYPIPQNKPVIKKNWNDFSEYSEAIIGDGVLNLEGIKLSEKLRNFCDTLICRVFLKKFSWMKYASYFPQNFPGASMVIPTQQDVCMVIWRS